MYNKEIKVDESFKKAQQLADVFSKLDGRRPRILIASTKKNEQDNRAQVVAAGFADVGFDVDISPAFQTTKDLTKQALENDVHVLGILLSELENNAFAAEIIEDLTKHGRKDIMVIVGVETLEANNQLLLDAGVTSIFGPDTKISTISINLLNNLIDSE
ncbi:cobalamin-dependent protein [Mariniflexile sp.]|uniref:cobalamin-dependent protein n=1 Tax=Mariniflexile sp. TaxID=1979402 RepID=UPI0035654BF3